MNTLELMENPYNIRINITTITVFVVIKEGLRISFNEIANIITNGVLTNWIQLVKHTV